MDTDVKNATTFATCLGTGQTLPKAEMLRFMRGPDGKAYLDLTGKGPGEGAYVTPTAEALHQAVTSDRLASTLAAEVPATLLDDVVQALTLKVLHSLGLAKKAGMLVLGQDKVREAAAKGQLQLLVLASDISPASGKDMAHTADRHGLKIFSISERSRLSALFGQANATVIGLKKAPISATVQTALLWYSAATNERLGND
jgi:predicted RNA-binding protein YlxR (DUF448 family)